MGSQHDWTVQLFPKQKIVGSSPTGPNGKI